VVVRGWNSEIPVRHERHDDLYWFGRPESKTLRPVWWWYYARESSAPEEGVDDVVMMPLRGAPGRLILAGVLWVTSRFPYILVSYNWESLFKLDCIVLYSKYLYVLGPACQVGEGPLIGRRVFW
jgi:hypothetical protein